MSYTQEQKERARQIDPACWFSYSGKPRGFKASMDARRTAALRQAVAELPAMHVREEGPFHLFGWCDYEAGGGMNDHVDSFDDRQDAKAAAEKGEFNHWHIVDAADMVIVETGYNF